MNEDQSETTDRSQMIRPHRKINEDTTASIHLH